jgi:endonuclease YncB( thermonuclease family)
MATEREDEESRRRGKKIIADYDAGKFGVWPRAERNRKFWKSRWFAVGVALVLSLAALALIIGLWPRSANLEGEVIRVADGDTLTLRVGDGESVRIRLAEIDAPERDQPYYQRAKQALANKVLRQRVGVEIVDRDKYGREVGKVNLDGDDVNAQMVAQGHVWVYRQYSQDPALLKLEAAARGSGLGLWALRDAERIPPWDWRRMCRGGKGQATKEPPDPQCLIKGNISSKKDRIYHVPGSGSYAATKITECKGERWLCSEEEALQAGWRAPKR